MRWWNVPANPTACPCCSSTAVCCTGLPDPIFLNFSSMGDGNCACLDGLALPLYACVACDTGVYGPCDYTNSVYLQDDFGIVCTDVGESGCTSDNLNIQVCVLCNGGIWTCYMGFGCLSFFFPICTSIFLGTQDSCSPFHVTFGAGSSPSPGFDFCNYTCVNAITLTLTS